MASTTSASPKASATAPLPSKTAGNTNGVAAKPAPDAAEKPDAAAQPDAAKSTAAAKPDEAKPADAAPDAAKPVAAAKPAASSESKADTKAAADVKASSGTLAKDSEVTNPKPAAATTDSKTSGSAPTTSSTGTKPDTSAPAKTSKSTAAVTTTDSKPATKPDSKDKPSTEESKAETKKAEVGSSGKGQVKPVGKAGAASASDAGKSTKSSGAVKLPPTSPVKTVSSSKKTTSSKKSSPRKAQRTEPLPPASRPSPRATSAVGGSRGSPRTRKVASQSRPRTAASAPPDSTPRYVTQPRRSGKVFAGGLQPHAPSDDRTESIGPGPGSYAKLDAFGAQPTSRRANSSQFSFGTSRKDDYSKMFLNKGLQAHMSNMTTKGVDYMEAPTGFFRMVQSKQKTAPTFSFGSAQRDAYLKSYMNKGMQARFPGKNTTGVDFIDAEPSFGRKFNSKKATPPSFSFGTGARLAYERQYNSKEAQAKMSNGTTKDIDFMDRRSCFGSMSESKWKTSSSFGFGTAERGHRGRMAHLAV